MENPKRLALILTDHTAMVDHHDIARSGVCAKDTKDAGWADRKEEARHSCFPKPLLMR